MLHIQQEATPICKNHSTKTTQCFPFANALRPRTEATAGVAENISERTLIQQILQKKAWNKSI